MKREIIVEGKRGEKFGALEKPERGCLGNHAKDVDTR